MNLMGHRYVVLCFTPFNIVNLLTQNRHFGHNITNSLQVEPPAKKQRTADTEKDRAKERLARDIVEMFREQTAVLARIFEVVSQ